ncbi:hypothetical protein GCM10023231_22310 [Olivibacter ginsenosidimutans]|uniref:WG repeat-containing protein n=2 Tax=Olivibacter ginsenosidimutans TaxID=1176537 RepID=A0ABP9BCQ3_9SPHI
MLVFAQQYTGGSIFLHGFARVEREGKSWYINAQGKQVFDRIVDYWNITTAGSEALDTGSEEAVYQVQAGKRYGVFDAQGNWLLDPIYDTIDHRLNQLWKVSKDGKVSLCTTDGKLLLPLYYEDVQQLNENFFAVKDQGKWGIYAKLTQQLQVPIQYDDVDYCGGCGYAPHYFLAKKNNKWGVVNMEGKVLAPFVFDHDHYQMRSDEWVMSFSRNGTRLVYNLAIGKAFEEPEYSNTCLLNNGFLALEKGGRYGLIAGSGKQVLDFDYEEITGLDEDTFRPVNPFVSVKKQNVFGLADTSGKMLVEPMYKQALKLVLQQFFWAEAEHVLINASGKVIFDAKDYNRMDVLEKLGILIFRKAGKWWAFDPVQQRLITNKGYEEIEDSDIDTPSVLLVKENGWWGALNMKGKMLVPVKYDKIGCADLGAMLYAKKGNAENIYTLTGQALLEGGYGYEKLDFQDTMLFKYYKIGQAYDHYGLMDRNGKIWCKNLYQAIYELAKGNYLLVQDSTYALLNTKTETIKLLPFKKVTALEKTNYLLVNQNNAYYLFDVNRGKLIPKPYETMEGLTHGYVKVSVGGKVGIVDTHGKTVIPLNYTDIWELKNGYFMVLQQSGEQLKYGFANAKGKLFVPIQYDYDRNLYRYLEDGYFLLTQRQDDTYAYLRGVADSSGRVLVTPNYEQVFPYNGHQGFLYIKDDKAGLLNAFGSPLCQQDYDDVILADRPEHKPLIINWPAMLKKGDTYFYGNEKGEWLHYSAQQLIPFIDNRDSNGGGLPIL